MADECSNHGVEDRGRINVNQPHEIRYWTTRLGVSEIDLRKAVAAVGSSAEQVAEHLGKA